MENAQTVPTFTEKMTTPASLLVQIIHAAYNQIAVLNEAELSQKPSPEKWSKKEILGHLIDSALNNHQRFIRAESQDNLVFFGYDQMAWVRLNNYQNRRLSDILETWAVTNRLLANVISNLPENLRTKAFVEHNFHQIGMNPYPAENPASLDYFFWDYLFHLEHHLAQIIPNYVKQNRASY